MEYFLIFLDPNWVHCILQDNIRETFLIGCASKNANFQWLYTPYTLSFSPSLSCFNFPFNTYIEFFRLYNNVCYYEIPHFLLALFLNESPDCYLCVYRYIYSQWGIKWVVRKRRNTWQVLFHLCMNSLYNLDPCFVGS